MLGALWPSTSPQAILRRVGEDRGTSLMELVVAMAAGIVVTLALLATLDFSWRQTTSLTDKVQANQLGRVAMTKILHELESSCLSPSFAPVQAGSTGSQLIFINAYSEKAVIPSAIEHKIVYSSSAKTLTDEQFNSNGGSWPSFTFPSTSGTPTAKILLASNVTLPEKGEVFEYYKYAESSESTSVLPLNTLEEEHPIKESELAEAKGAALVAAVRVSFNAAAADGSTTLKKSAPITGQVTFSFSVPNSETPIHDFPCQ